MGKTLFTANQSRHFCSLIIYRIFILIYWKRKIELNVIKGDEENFVVFGAQIINFVKI